MTPPITSLEFWYYVANIVGVIVLARYAWDTNQIKKASLAQAASAAKQAEAAKDQLEGLFIPCVLLTESRPEMHGQIRNYAFKNVGTGVALNISARLSSWHKDVSFQALSPGSSAITKLIPDDLVFRSPLVCTFESLSGTVYRSESSYNKTNGEIVTDIRHVFMKRPTGPPHHTA